MDAPWRWLGAGWRDLLAAPALSIGYGLFVVGGGVLIVATLWRAGLSALIPVAVGAFALVGPLLAVGLYEMSRRLEGGETPRLFPVEFAGPRSPLQIAFVGFFLFFAALIWSLVAMALYAIFTAGSYAPLDEFLSFTITTPQGLAMATIGTFCGLGIAFAIFLLTVVSIPMLMAERTDAFTAIATGVNAFRRAPGAMILWAWLIAVLIAGGMASLFAGLAVVFPLLGHASWHAYRDIRASV
jgi:uncharacterized membrane protein